MNMRFRAGSCDCGRCLCTQIRSQGCREARTQAGAASHSPVGACGLPQSASASASASVRASASARERRARASRASVARERRARA
eukprot:301983-Pleurochrysis_carterae.AAC.1